MGCIFLTIAILFLAAWIFSLIWALRKYRDSDKLFVAIITVLSAVIATIGTAMTWSLNNQEKIVDVYFQRKEEKYSEILISMGGLSQDNPDTTKAKIFLESFNTLWLYGSDDVVEAGYSFIDGQKSGSNKTDSEKMQLAGEFVRAMRLDLMNRKLISETKLNSTDFQLLGVNAEKLMQVGKKVTNP